MNFKVSLSANPEELRRVQPHVTVEAEYGDACVEGELLTLAHHGPRSGELCPCLAENGIFVPGEEIRQVWIGVSHIDLDTLGGIAAVLGVKPELSAEDDFWSIAARVDVEGVHRLHLFGASESTVDRLHTCFWWLEKNQPRVPAPAGAVVDVTDLVSSALAALDAILAGNQELLDCGREWAKAKAVHNQESFVEWLPGGVAVRVSPRFSNALYSVPDGRVARAVVALNTLNGSVTVSFAEPGTGNAREIVQRLWGCEAGGHVGIAGSPRGRKMGLLDLLAAAMETQRAILGSF